MALIGTLVSFTPSTTIVSADVNSNFSDIRTAFNDTAVLTDVARTVTVTHVWTVGQTFNSATFTTGITVTGGGVTITAGGLALGGSLATNIAINVEGNSGAGTVQYGGYFQTVFLSTATLGFAATAQVRTAAAAYTLVGGYGFHIQDASKGAGSTITTQYGLNINAQTQGTTNYGAFIRQGAVTGNAVRITQTTAMTDDAFVITGGTVTGSSAPAMLRLTQLWNTSGAPSAILVNVTNTASTGAKLLDLQVASVAKVAVDVNGALTAGVGTATSIFRVAQCLYQNQSLTTTSTGATTLATFSLPASALAVNGQAIRITMGGFATTASCSFVARLGSTTVINVTAATSSAFWASAIVTRTGAASQTIVRQFILDGTAAAQVDATPTETLANALSLDFRAATNAGGTASLHYVQVEYLAS